MLMPDVLGGITAGSDSKGWLDWPVWPRPEDQDPSKWTSRFDVHCVVASGPRLLGQDHR